ncbi:hypothetical protein BJY04DRAFT_211661 [Aspergillus karnatakaensis]|uniref:inositol monophosphatase family protein n=1 Tax=Aspergillus karnatakaensis TaxID=1810916 RepID=UPI003CCC9B52
MSTLNLQEICKDMIALAKSAGIEISEKKNTADIVTTTDRGVESHIRDYLASEYPSFDFIGEESHTGLAITNKPTFIVDPIDGTSNFVHGFPAVCVSIGLVIDKQPTVGVVYNPFLDELWYAVKGFRAFTTTRGEPSQRLPLTPRPLGGINSACIAIEWGSGREGPNFELNLHVFTTLARSAASGGKFVNSLRCIGSAAEAICRVAAGQVDAFWECGCWPWDVAAAWCVLVEAGGVMADVHPGLWDVSIDNKRYLAVRAAEAGGRKFVEEFGGVVGERRSTYGPLTVVDES